MCFVTQPLHNIEFVGFLQEIPIMNPLSWFMTSIALIQYSLHSNFNENAIMMQNKDNQQSLIRICTKLQAVITLEYP